MSLVSRIPSALSFGAEPPGVALHFPSASDLSRSGAGALTGLALLVCGSTLAQVVPETAVTQLQHAIGSRIEALTILGGDYASAGGIYTFRGGRLADLSMVKIGGGGDVTSASPLGLGGVEWAPVLEGNLGNLSAENQFQTGYLKGNGAHFDTAVVQGGAGVRFYFTENLSLAPTLSGIYGHTENEFHAGNALGQGIKTVAGGILVDYQVDTWSVAPALDFRYTWHWSRSTFLFSSRYGFFHTESFNSSSPLVTLAGDSHTWENKIDVDVPVGLKTFGREWHTGGFFSRTELFGNAAAGLNSSQAYTANARFVLDFEGKFLKVRWLGLGVSYVWGTDFSGWTTGVDLSFKL